MAQKILMSDRAILDLKKKKAIISSVSLSALWNGLGILFSLIPYFVLLYVGFFLY